MSTKQWKNICSLFSMISKRLFNCPMKTIRVVDHHLMSSFGDDDQLSGAIAIRPTIQSVNGSSTRTKIIVETIDEHILRKPR